MYFPLPTKNHFLLTLSLFITFFSFSQCNNPIWADEFEGPGLNLSKWAFQTGNGCPSLCGWGNGELETYTESTKNIKIENGILKIEAIKENVNGSSFTSSKIVTLGKASWKYGRMEARMRMPLGNGLWPAFWMLSTSNNWPMTGEIDIMEYRGDKPKQTNATLHYGSPWPHNQWDGSSHIHTADLSSDFHIYAVEWEESEIRFYFNNVLIKKETKTPNSLNPASNGNPWPWTTNFYIILNLAVGGTYAGSPTVNQVQLTKPTFEIDYVRVYSLPCSPTAVDDNFMADGNLKIFPQPFNNELNITLLDGSEAKVSIKDFKGNEIKKAHFFSTISLNLENISKGFYLVEVEQEGKRVFKKVLKQ